MEYDFKYLAEFLNERKKDIGLVWTNPAQVLGAQQAIEELQSSGLIKNKVVLDIGCGMGTELELFKVHGAAKVYGLSLGEDKELGEHDNIIVADQSFIPDTYNETFDLLFARHVLEHSLFPYFTLYGYNRVLKLLGHAYVEVPLPDCVVEHELNNNHYSVLTRKMWMMLFARTGFSVVREIRFMLHDKGPELVTETWDGFILRKECEPAHGYAPSTYSDMSSEWVENEFIASFRKSWENI
jgi:SAM-dependent methyltransferase